MNPGERILIVEDERPMRTALADCLAAEGYRVLTAENGEVGLKKATHEKPDLILLDVMMPRLDGFALCTELRRLNIRTPILFLTAKGMVQDRVTGLNAGGDDYLVKPFSSEELVARVRALIRRSRPETSIPNEVQIGKLTINFAAHTATNGSELLHLTPKEFAMLRLLVENAGQPIARERFLDLVWGYTAFPSTRTVDNHIAMLRAKIETDSNQPTFIQTVHGVGYKLNFAKT
jgi:DNA-binding response OmpR family regulator